MVQSDIDFSKGKVDSEYEYDIQYQGECYGESVDEEDVGYVGVELEDEVTGVDMNQFADAVEHSEILRDIIDVKTAYATVFRPTDFSYIDNGWDGADDEYWDV